MLQGVHRLSSVQSQILYLSHAHWLTPVGTADRASTRQFDAMRGHRVDFPTRTMTVPRSPSVRTGKTSRLGICGSTPSRKTSLSRSAKSAHSGIGSILAATGGFVFDSAMPSTRVPPYALAKATASSSILCFAVRPIRSPWVTHRSGRAVLSRQSFLVFNLLALGNPRISQFLNIGSVNLIGWLGKYGDYGVLPSAIASRGAFDPSRSCAPQPLILCRSLVRSTPVGL